MCDNQDMTKPAPTAASPEQLRARLELRRSSAAQPHRNRKKEEKLPGKGNRRRWKLEREN